MVRVDEVGRTSQRGEVNEIIDMGTTVIKQALEKWGAQSSCEPGRGRLMHSRGARDYRILDLAGERIPLATL